MRGLTAIRITLALMLLTLVVGFDDGCCGIPEGDPTGASCTPDSNLTYASFGADFMARYCTKCHSSALQGAKARHTAPPGLDLDELQKVRSFAAEIETTAASGPTATNDAMPPLGYPQPTLVERQQLAVWIACGLPGE